MYVEGHHIICKNDNKNTSTHARAHFRVSQEWASAQKKVWNEGKSEEWETKRRDKVRPWAREARALWA